MKPVDPYTLLGSKPFRRSEAPEVSGDPRYSGVEGWELGQASEPPSYDVYAGGGRGIAPINTSSALNVAQGQQERADAAMQDQGSKMTMDFLGGGISTALQELTLGKNLSNQMIDSALSYNHRANMAQQQIDHAKKTNAENSAWGWATTLVGGAGQVASTGEQNNWWKPA